MKHRHTHSNRMCTCSIIPPHILDAIARNGTPTQRALAERNLALDTEIRERRAALLPAKSGKGQGAGPPRKNRLIYTANNTRNLPGTLVRSEGQPPSGDVAVNEAYDGLGATFDLYSDVYGRNSIDDNGMDLIGSVHVGNQWDNAQWNGSQMLFGDGDGTLFNRFTIAIDVMGHELTHGVTERTAQLEYHDQSGALNESISDVFGSLVKQRSLGQTAAQADWLIGAGIWAAGVNGVALRSMKAPGTAYNDPVLGKDPQPDHMSHYDKTTRDNGGVHINSGIPNKAFYLTAMALGGNAWDVAGNIWYRTLLDSRLSAKAQFQDFAYLTADTAEKLYGGSAKAAVAKAWHDVGISLWQQFKSAPAGSASLSGYITAVSRIPGSMEMFWIGADGSIQDAFWYEGSAGWTQFTLAPAGSASLSGGITSVARIPGSIEIQWIGADGSIQDAFWYEGSAGWQRFTLAPPGSASLTGGITSVARIAGSIEIQWIGADGSIQDAFWYEGSAGWTQFTLAPAGSASLTGGITSVSRIPGSIEIQWIGPDGSIQDAFWYEGSAEWQRFTLAPPGSASLTRGITSVARIPGSIEIQWIGADGSIQDAFWYEGSAGWQGFRLAPAGSASLIGGITSVARIPGSIEVQWIGADGSIQDAYWYEGAPGWRQFTLAPSGSASLSGEIAAVSRIPSSIEMQWVGSDGSIQDAFWYG